MNFFAVEDKQVRCSCFPLQSLKLTGLKRAAQKQITDNQPQINRPAKSTQAKGSESHHSRNKKSLKRQKPKTPRHNRNHTYDSDDNQNARDKLGKLSERQKYLFSVRMNDQHKCLQEPSHRFVPEAQEKDKKPKARKTLRGHPQKLNHEPIPLESIPFQKNYKIQNHTRETVPSFQEKIIHLSKPHQIQEKNSKQELKPVEIFYNNQQNNHSISFRRINKNEDSVNGKKGEKTIIYPKEAESLVDEDNFEDDQMSEVLGWGWEGQRTGEKPQKIQTLLTMASNIKNSSTVKNSLVEQEELLFPSHRKA